MLRLTGGGNDDPIHTASMAFSAVALIGIRDFVV
jgi:hypothetical protein